MLVTMNVYAHVLKEGHKLEQEPTIRKLLDAMARPALVPPNLKKGGPHKPRARTGAGDRTRTDDLRITSALLYH